MLYCPDSGATDVPENTAQAITTYSQIVLASYQDSLAAAQAMDTTLQAFTAAPSAATLGAAKTAWLTSREPYLQTEVYRFYDGPIDDADGPEGLMNAWPLDESYIDYVDGMPTAGIVNGSEELSATNLEALNEQGGEENVATGYHAIEFLLCGQDMRDTGPGARPDTDIADMGTAERRVGRRWLELPR